MIVLSGMAGVLGILAAAAAYHLGGDNIQIASQFLLIHAPVFLAAGIAQGDLGRALAQAAAMLALGVAIFCADLAAHHTLGHPLFPYAAPAGAILMILGWLGMAAAGVRHRG